MDAQVAEWIEKTKHPLSSENRQRGDDPTRRLRLSLYRQGAVLYFFNHFVAQLPSHRLRLFFYRQVFEIGQKSSILLGLKLYYPGRLIIGDHSVINAHCLLDSRAGIYIGNSVSISPFVQIWSGGHDINSRDFASQGGVTIIEDFVWIAASAIIAGSTPGSALTLGKGCVITAGSVVVRDVEPFTVVAGNPARKIAVRSQDLDYKLNYFPPFQ